MYIMSKDFVMRKPAQGQASVAPIAPTSDHQTPRVSNGRGFFAVGGHYYFLIEYLLQLLSHLPFDLIPDALSLAT